VSTDLVSATGLVEQLYAELEQKVRLVRPKDDFTQLRLNSAVTFHLAPEIKTVKHGFLWTKTKALTFETMHLQDVPVFWADMLPRVARYQQAHDQQNFPPKPGFLCRDYCRVKSCQYWEPKR